MHNLRLLVQCELLHAHGLQPHPPVGLLYCAPQNVLHLQLTQVMRISAFWLALWYPRYFLTL